MKRISLFLLGAGLCAAGEFTTLCRFDFGDDFQEVAPGWQPVSRVYRSPRFLWVNAVRDVEIEGEQDPLRRDAVSGAQGEFWVGLPNGDYRATLIMYDKARPHGPISVFLQDRLARSDVVAPAGQAVRLALPVQVRDGKFRLRLEASAGQIFVLNGLIIEGPAGTRLHPMFQGAPPDALPAGRELMSRGVDDARTALRAYCEWLLARRLPNGFLGDYEASQTRTNYYWYTSAYPIRTLLAGYHVFGERRYLDAVTTILDRLVEEQMPNGAFQQVFRGKPTSALTKTEIRDIMEHRWMNMADVGCIVTALAVAAQYVEEPRKTTYRDAARRYCDDFATQWQKPNGGFTNGLESGVPQTNIYSVATGTEAAAFAALYAITGEPKYLKVAQRAAEFLLDNWQPDGRPVSYPHMPAKPVQPRAVPVTHFGDIFYYHDGILFVLHQSKDPKFRERVRRVYAWHIQGEKGLLAAAGSEVWWPLQDAWDNSKTGGMPPVLLAYAEMRKDPAVRSFLNGARRFLMTPEFSRRIGVMLEDPDLAWGGHSLQSWSGCSIAATGFAGLTIAEMAKPGVIYPAPY